MLALLFKTDHLNYARFLATCIASLEQIECSNPEAKENKWPD